MNARPMYEDNFGLSWTPVSPSVCEPERYEEASWWGGSLLYFTQNIDIWVLFDPKKRGNSPRAIPNQKNLTESKNIPNF